jgi:hypothetical protein
MSCVGAFFLSIAYSGLLYAILGISAAYQAAVARELREAESVRARALAQEAPEPALA